MKLNPFNPGSVRVQRGRSGGGLRAGGLGCGGLVIVIIGALVFGVDPGQMLGMVEQTQQTTTQRSGPATDETAMEICDDNQYSMETCNTLGSLNETWQPLFEQQGVDFRQPLLTFIEGGSVQTGCGVASSAVGPFYCPADETINIDVGFYDQMARELGAGGDFARYYVVAHEYGHHVQAISGIADQIRSAQQQNPSQANQLQVMMELHADCYAGVWAGRNRNLIEPGDFEEGMQAAASIGDDALMERAGRRANPESFTHGSSEQRMAALRLGMETGDDIVCDNRILNAG